MGLLDFIRGNSVDRLDTRELKEEEMRLQNHIELARKDILKIEKQKKDMFKQGVGADLIKKKMLAQQIKHLDVQAQMKIKQFMMMHKQYMFVSNLVVVKKYEKELKQNKIWSKITNIEPSKFESALINVNLKGKSFEEVLNNLNNVFEMSLTESGLEDLWTTPKNSFSKPGAVWRPVQLTLKKPRNWFQQKNSWRKRILRGINRGIFILIFRGKKSYRFVQF